jgi:amino acid transporter
MARIGAVGLIVLSILGILLGVILILIGLLLTVSPGKAKPFLDEKGLVLSGSISEKIHGNINGVQQGMFIMFYAYIGVGQMSYQLKSEMLSYEYMVGRYKAIGNTKMVVTTQVAVKA